MLIDLNTIEDQGGYTRLLEVTKSVNPALYEKLQARFIEDRENFVAYLKLHSPSKSAKDWAKRDCKNCNSRGIINFLDGRKSVCSCAVKAYTKWVKQQRVEFNKLRGQVYNGEKKSD